MVNLPKVGLGLNLCMILALAGCYLLLVRSVNKRNGMMSILSAWTRPLNHPKVFLMLSFVAWKSVLLCIALTSPGPGYDTSTVLLAPESNLAQAKLRSEWQQDSGLQSLVRWDAIYFTQSARRGYLWEQEWAFGWGYTTLIAVTSRGDYDIALTRCMRLITCSLWIQ